MDLKDKLNYLLNRAEELDKSIKLVYETESKDHSRFAKQSAYPSHKTFAIQQKDLAMEVMKTYTDASFLVYNTDIMKSSFDSLYDYRRDIMDGVMIETGKILAFLKAKTGQKQNEIEEIINLLNLRLRSIIRTTPKKEIEIQKSVENLLIGRGYNKGIDFDRETGRVKTGIKESVPDFIFNTLDLAIEIKLVTKKHNPKKVTEEINADITSYGTKYNNIFFLVYDAEGCIQNMDEFKSISTGRHIYVEVVKN